VLPSEQDRADVARFRARWKKYQGLIDPKRLVFIDETWAKTNMAPLRGWCPRGERLEAQVPYGHWKTMTFVAALRCDRIDAPCVFDGPINGASFQAYVETVLVPTLERGDVVILDNLGSHKSKAVRDAVRAVGAKLLFCRPIVQISIQSNNSSQSSSIFYEKQPHEPSRRRGGELERCSTNSSLANA
jgi:hypothetical protein